MQRHTRARVIMHCSNIPRTRTREILACLPLELLASIFLQVYSWIYFVYPVGNIEPEWQRVEHLVVETNR